jgi:type I restriction enzyme R subunit
LGLFVRSLVGLDREATQAACAGFLAGRAASAKQIEFVDMIINHLTEHGVMDAGQLHASPHPDFSPKGVEGGFPSAQVDVPLGRLQEIRRRAAA